jgi:tetratricopeptide (TPR) repeat protein
MSQLRAGHIVAGQYEIRAHLGSGGGGDVFRATQLATGQLVALKFLRTIPGLDAAPQDKRRRRFRRELDIVTRLRHPDIVRLIDYGKHETTEYLVFEYVDGRPLSAVLRAEGALPVETARSLMCQLLEVLAHAHAHGVVHRDIKPSNLMVLDRLGRPRIKVLDFGVGAILVDDESGQRTALTASGEMIGTPAYAAPEQLRGEEVSSRADLYAWALVVVECLVGAPVMLGRSAGETIQNQLSSSPVPLPPELRNHPFGELLAWALDKQVARRPAQAAQLLARLERLEVAELTAPSGFLYGRCERPPGIEPISITEVGAIVGERRQVAVLCCRVSPRPHAAELLDELIFERCHRQVAELVRTTSSTFGGRVVGELGTMTLIYFGLDRSRGLEPTLINRAILELDQRLTKLADEQGFDYVLEVGAHAGVVITHHDDPNRDHSRDHIAAEAVAMLTPSPPGPRSRLVASAALLRLLPRGEATRLELAGTAETVALSWSAAGLPVRALELETLGSIPEPTVARARMIGRDAELDRLLTLAARSGPDPRAVLVRGQAGIGKSRLVEEFARARAQEGVGALRLSFVPEAAHVALARVLDCVLTTLDLDGPPSCATLDRVLCSSDVDRSLVVPLLCTWLMLPITAPHAPLMLSPPFQRKLLIAALVAIFDEQLERRGADLIIEDVHWADASSREWLGQLLDRRAQRGAFMLLTARPEFSPSATAPAIELVELLPLARAEVEALVAAFVGHHGHDPAPMLAEQVGERSDGIPLFIEELTRELLAHNLDDGPPPSLRNLMAARLDRLGRARQTAQYAAAIGREFDYELLAESVPDNEATLLGDLAELVDAGLLEAPTAPAGIYLFRHALLRDAAYASLPAESRRRVHESIALALRDEFDERVQARPDLAARHLEGATMFEDALAEWLRASARAAQAAAHAESLAHLDSGFRVLAALPPGPARDQAEIDLLNAKGATLIAKLGHGHPDVRATFTRAIEFVGEAPPSRRGFLALKGLWAHYFTLPELARAVEIGHELAAQADQADDVILKLGACESLAQACYWRGEFAETVRQRELCIEHYDPELNRELIATFGINPWIACISFGAQAQLMLGELDEAVARHDEAVAIAHEIGHPGLLAGILATAGSLHVMRGAEEGERGEDLAIARWQTKEATRLAAEGGFEFWLAAATLVDADARVLQGEHEALVDLEQAIAKWRAAGAGLGIGWHLTCVARGHQGRGQHERALECLARADLHVARGGEGYCEAEIARIRARSLAAVEPEAARAELERALTLARSRRARLHELRAGFDLQRLLTKRGEAERGREQLRDILTWWREHPSGLELASVRSCFEAAGLDQPSGPATRAAKPR